MLANGDSIRTGSTAVAIDHVYLPPNEPTAVDYSFAAWVTACVFACLTALRKLSADVGAAT